VKNESPARLEFWTVITIEFTFFLIFFTAFRFLFVSIHVNGIIIKDRVEMR